MNTWKKHGKTRAAIVALSLFLGTVALQSCKDDYFYDDTEPDWLGASIYEYLEEQGNFTYFLKVIDDNDYTEVLKKTGSKTLFAADDAAFMEGIKKAWGLTSYDQLTENQKKIILFNSMLDNAYLLEMLSSTAAPNSSSDPVEGRCLRQVSSANIVDSIGYFYNADLPQNNPFWDAYREKGIRLATDGTKAMMVHFIDEQLRENNIKLSDLNLLFNFKYSDITDKDAFIFDKRVVKQNVTCKNGYVHQVDGLLIPPSNMAEEIRTNGKTKLFSRILDRFSVPYYDESNSNNRTLNEDYNRIYHYGDDANAEKVYEKRYFTDKSNRGSDGSGFLSILDDNNVTQNAKASLLYDPGWNNYKSGTTNTSTPENDMASMFVPNDEVLTEYFMTGAGKHLRERFGKRADGTEITNIEEIIDSIPIDVVQWFARNVMMSSFNNTVPSKFGSILDDARRVMGITEGSIDNCIIANNGVVYITNEVFSPSRYVAVIAPVTYAENLKIMQWAINAFDYDKYLLAMDSYFSLIVPSDEALTYYDPTTLNDPYPTMYKFHYNEAKKNAEVVWAEQWTYDPVTMQPMDSLKALTSTGSSVNSKIKNCLEQLLEYYIVVGDFQDGNKYHMSKGYGTVKVEADGPADATGRPTVTKIYGGQQLEQMAETGADVFKAPGEVYNMENGNTYRLDNDGANLVMPATHSVYKTMKQTPEFAEFFNLCNVDEDVANLIAYKDPTTGKVVNDSLNKYIVFENTNKIVDDYNVRTFNTYHYTVYIPTNDDILQAYSEGLPSWEELGEKKDEITEWSDQIADLTITVDSLIDAIAEQTEASAGFETPEILQMKADTANIYHQIDALQTKVNEETAIVKAKAELIIAFVKYHIQDNSVYVDELPHCVVTGIEEDFTPSYETAALDPETKRFSKLTVETVPGSYSSHATMHVTDAKKDGDTSAPVCDCYIINEDGTEGTLFNVMTRDIVLNGSNIETSSYAVLHLIDGVLVNDRIYDSVTHKFKLAL